MKEFFNGLFRSLAGGSLLAGGAILTTIAVCILGDLTIDSKADE